jgi:hypothetical protein
MMVLMVLMLMLLLLLNVGHLLLLLLFNRSKSDIAVLMGPSFFILFRINFRSIISTKGSVMPPTICLSGDIIYPLSILSS